MNKDEWMKAVKIALIEKDMNQVDLADKLGLSRTYVSSIINGSTVEGIHNKEGSIHFQCRILCFRKESGGIAHRDELGGGQLPADDADTVLFLQGRP